MEPDITLAKLLEAESVLDEQKACIRQTIAFYKELKAKQGRSDNHKPARSRIAAELSIVNNGNSDIHKKPVVRRKAFDDSAVKTATQEAARTLLRSGKPYVQTGETIKVVLGRGLSFRDKKPSKDAYNYLRACKDLEHIKVTENGKTLGAWAFNKSNQTEKRQMRLNGSD